MKIFKHKQKDTASKTSDKVAGWIASGIFKVQSSWAKAMDKCFNQRSLKSRKIMLIATCFLIVAYSTILLGYGFNKIGTSFIKPVSVMLPVAIGKTNPNLPSGVPAFIKRIERFKHYLDSLGRTNDGRKYRDSLLLRRPGLLDSIRNIERIYCEK